MRVRQSNNFISAKVNLLILILTCIDNTFPSAEQSQPQDVELVSSTVSSQDSSQFSFISNSIEKIEETIKRDESINENLHLLGLEQRCVGLERELEEERAAKGRNGRKDGGSGLPGTQ